MRFLILERNLNCPKRCDTCPMATLTDEDSTSLTGPNGNTVIGTNGNTVVVEGKFTCKSENVIYFIYYRRRDCRQAYVGQTTKRLQDRMKTHRNKINTTLTTYYYVLNLGIIAMTPELVNTDATKKTSSLLLPLFSFLDSIYKYLYTDFRKYEI